MANEEDKKDPFDGEYLGNIWGWRLTMWGSALIVVMVLLMIYRHNQLGVGFGEEMPERPEVVDPDSVIQEDFPTGTRRE